MMMPSAISAAHAIVLLSLLCGFIVRMTAAYLLCALIARFAISSPALRFVVWLGFLSGSCAYWFFCIAQGAASFATAAPAAAPALPVTAGEHLLVPLSLVVAHRIASAIPLAALVYAAALVLLLLAGVWERVQLWRILRHRVQPGTELRAHFEKIRSQVGAPACGIWLLPGLPSPASRGWLMPAIYLPAEDMEATADLSDVLLHEITHVQRRDSLWDSLARVCRCLLFFHPLASRAFASLRLEREMACDRAVVHRAPEQRARYAESLVRFGWKITLADRTHQIGTGFVSQAAVLNARVTSILKRETAPPRWLTGARALAISACLWGFALILPALWVGFALFVASPEPAVLPAPLTVHSFRPQHHARRNARLLDPTPAPIAAALSLPAPMSPPAQPVTPNTQRTRLVPASEGAPSDDQPQSPSIIDISEGSPPSSSHKTRRRVAQASAVANSALALVRILGRDRGIHERE